MKKVFTKQVDRGSPHDCNIRNLPSILPLKWEPSHLIQVLAFLIWSMYSERRRESESPAGEWTDEMIWETQDRKLSVKPYSGSLGGLCIEHVLNIHTEVLVTT